MRTAIATLILVLAVGTAQAEAETARATAEEPGAEPGVEAAVEPESEPATEAEAEHAAEPAAEPAVAPEAEDECLGSPVPVRRMGVRGSIWVHLADCKGRPFQAAAQALSALAVPLPPREETRAEASGEDHGEEPGADALPRINPELLMRLQRVAEKYPGRTIEIVSGYRTRASAGSRHRHFDALDIRIEGVSNEELAAFARTFEATGVGYYPNSSFVHLDVRELAAYWVDESGPGEPAKYAHKEALAPSADAEESPAKTEAEIISEAAIVAAKLAEPTDAKDEPVAAAKVEDETKDAPLTEEAAATEPVAAAEPVAAEAAAVEPAQTEPAQTEPATAEPAAAEPVAAEPASAEPAAAEPVTAQPAKAAPATSPAPVSPQLASIAERALIVMKRALGRAGVQDTAL